MKYLSMEETQAHIAALGMEHPSVASFAYLDTAHDVVYDWHAHMHHQLLYACSGTLRVEAQNHLYLLPPQRAIWIPAGVMHRTTLNHVQTSSIFLLPTLVPIDFSDVRVIAAAPILREMLLFATRWNQFRDPKETLANLYFETLGNLCAEWLTHAMPFQLPNATTPALKAAIQITLSNLAHVTLMQAAHAANLSTRHFSRRFKQETGLEWRQFRLHARLLWAMELLLESHLQITQVAYQVGFNNLSAFAKAFALLTGETPSCYRAKNCRLAIISTK